MELKALSLVPARFPPTVLVALESLSRSPLP